MPVFLDPDGVIGLDRVNDFCSLGQLDGKLAFAAPQSVCAADLVETGRFHEVDVAQFTSTALLYSELRIFGLIARGYDSTDFCEIVFAPVSEEFLQPCGARPLSAQLPQCVVVWEVWIVAGFKPDFTFDWNSTKFSHQASEIQQEVVNRPCRREFGDYRLHLEFEDGANGVVDLAPHLTFLGVFEPLRDPAYFAQVRVDPDLGTVAWPNGADLDPDVLYARITGTPAFAEPDFHLAC